MPRHPFLRDMCIYGSGLARTAGFTGEDEYCTKKTPLMNFIEKHPQSSECPIK